MVTNLRARREKEGASLTFYAARVGVSAATYGPIESGRMQPTGKVAKMLEDAFGEPVTTLLALADVGKNVTA